MAIKKVDLEEKRWKEKLRKRMIAMTHLETKPE